MSFAKDRANRVDILIAEVDPDMRHDLRRLLEQEGFHCTEARSGPEAVDLAQEHPPQFVLLDLVPTREDFAVARWLRADPRTHTAYIHCLAPPTDRQAQVEAAKAGCDVVLCKPVVETELLKVVHQELGYPTEWAHDLSKSEAEDLLDWLEHQGSPGQVEWDANLRLSVRCPGFQVLRDDSGHLLIRRRELRVPPW